MWGRSCARSPQDSWTAIPAATFADDDAIHNDELASRWLHALARHLERLAAKHRRGYMRRRSRQDRGTRRVRADAMRNEIGSSVNHFDVLVMNPERVSANLRHHGFKPLPH